MSKNIEKFIKRFRQIRKMYFDFPSKDELERESLEKLDFELEKLCNWLQKTEYILRSDYKDLYEEFLEEDRKYPSVFEIRRSKDDKYYFVLKAKNRQIIATSELYERYSGCIKGINSVVENTIDYKVVNKQNAV